jgi:Lamin Tail Domain
MLGGLLKKMSKNLLLAIAFGLLLAASSASGNSVFITEFISDTGNNEHFEFVEFTNVGSLPVNMTGWSEDDSHATPNKAGHSLSAFGTLAPGESAIYTEATPADFRTYWGLPSSVKVIGPYTTDNLSTTGDSVTLFDGAGTLVDRIDYSPANGGTADLVSRNAPLSALGTNNNLVWVNSSLGDHFGSFHSALQPSIIGNPGSYPVPEPASQSVLVAGGLTLLALTRRLRATRRRSLSPLGRSGR